MTALLTPMLRELWQHVVRIGRPQTSSVYARDEQIRMLMRKHNAVLRDALDLLVESNYLRRSSTTSWANAFWFGVGCTVPEGCEAPGPLPSSTTGPRRHVNASMPIDTAPCARAAQREPQYPSRRGETLRWRDGRVTDLEGRPC